MPNYKILKSFLNVVVRRFGFNPTTSTSFWGHSKKNLRWTPSSSTHTKKKSQSISESTLPKLDPATSYLSGRSSSEYCHRYQSLRSCSGWERVVSWRFVTGNLAYSAFCCEINRRFSHFLIHLKLHSNYFVIINSMIGKALVRLVQFGWMCCHTYTSCLSTTWSAWGLTWLLNERTHLTVGFVLICFQHLSASNTATRRLPLAG